MLSKDRILEGLHTREAQREVTRELLWTKLCPPHIHILISKPQMWPFLEPGDCEVIRVQQEPHGGAS